MNDKNRRINISLMCLLLLPLEPCEIHFGRESINKWFESLPGKHYAYFTARAVASRFISRIAFYTEK